MFIFGSNTADFLLLLSYRQTTLPTMSFIQGFWEQSVYLGMPDDSVRNTVFPVAKAKHPVFPFFRLFLWYARVEKLIWQ